MPSLRPLGFHYDGSYGDPPPPKKDNNDRKIAIAVQVFGLAIVLLSASVAGVYLKTGSLSSSVQWLRGERLLLSPARVDLGTVVGNQEIEFQLELRNLTLRPVTLVGA